MPVYLVILINDIIEPDTGKACKAGNRDFNQDK